MVKVKYIDKFIQYFRAFQTFTSADAKLFLRKNGASPAYYKIFMHNLVKAGKVFPIGRGRYTLRDDPMVSGFAFSPFYFGLETSLTYYGLWDYATPISIVTTRRTRKGMLAVMGRNVIVRHISRKNFFGYKMVPYNDIYIPMADIEKTLIDSVYFHSRFDQKTYAAMVSRIDQRKLGLYLKHYPKPIKQQVAKIMLLRKMKEKNR